MAGTNPTPPRQGKEFALIIRLDNPSYPFCIEEFGANGSHVIIERWATEALAADRIWDIKDKEVRELSASQGHRSSSWAEPG
jgi:hypothetical protein